jgi:hypothetical protein
MKNIKRIMKGFLKQIMLNDDDFVPIYAGDELLSFQYRKAGD